MRVFQLVSIKSKHELVDLFIKCHLVDSTQMLLRYLFADKYSEQSFLWNIDICCVYFPLPKPTLDNKKLPSL